jgi:GT2 family glycosyltransferase
MKKDDKAIIEAAEEVFGEKDLLSIVMPICNTDYPPAHYTGNAIGSIRYFTKRPHELIVIDNASTVTLGGWKWKDVADVYIKNKKNMGVPYAWNQGIKKAKGKYIAVVNSDIQVYDNWAEDMIESLEHVSAVMAYPMYDMPWGRAKEAWTRRAEWLEDDPDKYLSDFRDFSCFMTTSKIYRAVGLFDENYGIGYGEDVDFCFRLEKKGFTIKSNKRVNTHHVGMATGHSMGGQGLDLGAVMEKNRKYTKKKWKLDKLGQPKFRLERIKKAHGKV